VTFLYNSVLSCLGISYLSEAISNMVHGMQSLDLAQCSIGNKGVNRLMESISSNHIMANTLCTLYLSGNNLKGDELRVSCLLLNYVICTCSNNS